MTGLLLSLGLALSSTCAAAPCGAAHLAEEVVATVAPQPSPAEEPNVVAEAMKYLGVRYRMGGSSRERGLDCANLVRLVFREERGLELPWSAAQLFLQGAAVPAERLAPGDLVFFKNTYKRGISHVGLYIGDGRFVHAASRKRGVVVSPMSAPYYRSRFAGARRILEPGETIASGG